METTLDDRNDPRPGFTPAGVCANCPYASLSLIPHPSSLSFADLTLDLITRKVERAGKAIDLALREFDLLAYLMREAVKHPGQPCSREELLVHVWHLSPDTNTNSVTVHVERLRHAIDDGHPIKLIHTVRAKGYMIKE